MPRLLLSALHQAERRRQGPRLPADSKEKKDDAWYSLAGVRLSGKPTQRGIYINNGNKVVIK